MEDIEKEDWRRKCERYVNHVQSQHEDMHTSPTRIRPSQAFTTSRDGGGTCHHEIRSAFLLSSAHGLPFAARAKHPCAKALWISIFLGVCGCLAYFLYLLVLRYMQFGFTSVSHFKAPRPPDTFPAVTVCNVNVLRRTQVENSRFKTILGKHSGRFLSNNDSESASPMIDVTPKFSSLLTFLNQNGIKETANFLNQLDRLRGVRKESLPSREDLCRIYEDTHDMELVWWALELTETEVEALGHTDNETIVLCHFNGNKCSSRSQFSTTHDINFGNCFTWQSDKSTDYSTNSGLEITFDIKLKEYLGFFNDELGLRVFIHQSGTSFHDGPEYSATPGMMTSFAITEHHHIRPSRNCSPTPMPTCLSKAIAARTEAVCGCSLPGKKGASLSICKTSNQFQYVCCAAVRMLYVSGKVQTECKAECREIIYDVATSHRVWPSSAGLDFMRGELNKAGRLNVSSVYLKENIGKLRVVYADHFLRVEEEKEEFMIFLTHVGGATALLLGISSMTVVELVYIFFEAIWWAVTSCRRQPKATRIEYLRPSAGGESVISSFGQAMKQPSSSKRDSPDFNWKLQQRANFYLPAVDPEEIKIYDTTTSTLYRQAWVDANARFPETAQLPNIPNGLLDQGSQHPGNSNDITWYYRKPNDEAALRKKAKIISELAADKKNLLDANKKVYF